MNIVRISMSYDITRIPGAMAAITTLQHEVIFLRKDLDNNVSERDKLRSDLQVNIIGVLKLYTFLTIYFRLQMSGRASLQLNLMNNKLYMIIL